MALKPTGIIRQLGWRGFFQLLSHLPSFVKLFSRLIKDPRVSLNAKLLLAGSLVYVIVPTDLLPDFLIGVGQMDDRAVVLAGLKFFLQLCPRRSFRNICERSRHGKRVVSAVFDRTATNA